MKMLLELGKGAEPSGWTRRSRQVRGKEKILAWPSCVSPPRIRGPRTAAGMSQEPGKRAGTTRGTTCRAHRALVKAEKKLNRTSISTPVQYYSLGIPIDLYTPIFAVSRMSGWTAHVLEQYANNRLIRPPRYTGPTTRSASFRSITVTSAARSRVGIVLVGGAFFVRCRWRREPLRCLRRMPASPAVVAVVAAAFATTGIVFAVVGDAHLGKQWSFAARVIEGNQLIIARPVRNGAEPIYAVDAPVARCDWL